MNLCINGYSDYISQVQPEVCESAVMPLNADNESYQEVLPAVFLNLDKLPQFIPSSERYNYAYPPCKVAAGLHAFYVAAQVFLVAQEVRLFFRDDELTLAVIAAASTIYGIEFAFVQSLRSKLLATMDQFCRYPPASPRGGRREFDEREVKDPGKHKFVPIVPEEVSVWEKIAAALAAAGAKALEVRKEADESAAAFAGAVGGVLFVMPLNSSLLEFHNPDFDPI